jgi:predicted amidohydrolase YtcJ
MARMSLLALAAVVFAAGAASVASAQQADLLLTNGKIYVGGSDPTTPTFAEAVAMKDGAILFVGTMSEAQGVQAAETIDLKGKLVLPGFVDAHVHAAEGGIAAGQCSLSEAGDLADSDRIIRACLAAKPPKPGEWFEVVQASFVGQHIPISHWDELRSDGPMIVRGLDYHTVYVNSAALKAAGVTAETPVPEGGSMDLSQGFFADAAMDVIFKAMPEPSAEETAASYLEGAAYAMRHLNALGITSIREAIASKPQFAAYAKLAAEKRATLRVEQSILVEPKADPKAEIAKAVALREEFANTPFMTANSIKIFADGVIEFPAQTAALRAPYLDPETGKPGSRSGEVLFDPATIVALVAEADRQGFDVHVHAIGDGAVHETLNAYEALRKTAGPDRRHLSIVHLELIDPADFPRFAALSVGANFQHLWSEPDSYTIESLLPYLGPDRHRWLYPSGSLYAAKAPLSAGSDWPVTTANPFRAIQNAVLRTNPGEADYKFDIANIGKPTDYIRTFDGRPFPVLAEEEKLPVKVVIDSYTMGSAREIRLDDKVGSIAVGKRADMIVLDRDIFELAKSAPQEIGAIHVCRTYFEGKQVYSDRDAQEILGEAPSANCE